MKATLPVMFAAASVTLAFSLAAMLAAQAPPLNLTGTWKGTGHDTFVRNNAADGMRVTWVLTQTGSAISGTVRTTALVPGDGSCSSCHRDKTGTVSGTISGSALSLTMDFPGMNGEVTALCAVTLNGTASAIANNTFTTAYSGTDSCENVTPGGLAFENGSLVMTRDPSIAVQPQSRTIPSGQAATLSVEAAGTPPFSYQWYAGTTGTTSGPIGGATSSSYTTPAITSVSRFWVRVSNASVGPFDSDTATLTPGEPFTDDTLTAGVSTIRAVHITELRTRIDALRMRFGLSGANWTETPIGTVTTVQAIHVAELRTALEEAYAAAKQTPPVFADPTLVPGGTTISALHLQQLRNAVIALESA
jgi:hypothetical protein